MKILSNSNGYYSVRPENLQTYRRVISILEFKNSSDRYYVRYAYWHKLIESIKVPGFTYLGYEETETEKFITQKAYWAKEFFYVREI